MKTKLKKTSVCLMFGGKSVEHDISILSGLQVYHALDKNKYDITIVYITKGNKMLIGKDLSEIETYKKEKYVSKKYKKVYIDNVDRKAHLTSKRYKKQIDVFIPIVHGEGVEDGTISSILEFNNATYINANLTSSAIAQDKAFTKDILKKYHINTPKYLCIENSNNINQIVENILTKLHLPVILKPIRLGSSIGIEKVSDELNLVEKLKKTFEYSERIIVEEMVPNIKEYNCAAFKFNNKIYISSVEEVTTNSDYLTFFDKYINSKTKEDTSSSRIIPANISEKLEEQIKTTTKNIYQILDMNGVIRIDYIYNVEKDKLYFNEVNTIPGSLSFYLFEDVGIKFNILLDMLIKEALLIKNNKEKKIKTFNSNVLNSKTTKLKK